MSAKVDAVVRRQMHEQKIPGLSLAVRRGLSRRLLSVLKSPFPVVSPLRCA